MRLESKTFTMLDLMRPEVFLLPMDAVDVEVIELPEGGMVVTWVELEKGDVPVQVGHC